ncbi:Polycomb protein esc [Sarcoptes scabiei]|uniref:Polycomb protein esc n=1 Tax=Sarcoptes scabiei TaxID=52283 RepID=A0A834RKM0_SARSC|nr:Polycomb protein esc [Sarcoptes scabiei]
MITLKEEIDSDHDEIETNELKRFKIQDSHELLVESDFAIKFELENHEFLIENIQEIRKALTQCRAMRTSFENKNFIENTNLLIKLLTSPPNDNELLHILNDIREFMFGETGKKCDDPKGIGIKKDLEEREIQVNDFIASCFRKNLNEFVTYFLNAHRSFFETIRVCKKPNYIKATIPKIDSKPRKSRRKKVKTKPITNLLSDTQSSLIIKFNSFWHNPEFPVMYGAAFDPYCVEDNIFAVCGNNLAIVFRCLDQHNSGLLPLFTYCDKNDAFFACCWTYDIYHADHHYLIVAGQQGVIRVIDVLLQKEVKTLLGHGCAVNDLKICPSDPNLLLSASKDYGIRLWNIHNNICIAIFGGVQGHRNQVVSIDFHQEKRIFASVSLDHSIKIWSLEAENIADAIVESQSYNSSWNGRQFPTVSQHYPNFSTRDVHYNYVDSVQWYNNFLITKSCEEKLVIWKPGTENETLDDLMRRTHYSDSLESNLRNVVIIKQFDLIKNDLWFVKFAFDHNEFLLALGNHEGNLFIYDLKSKDADDYRLVFNISNSNFKTETHSKVIRQTVFNKDGTILITLSENSVVTRYDIARLYKSQITSYIKQNFLSKIGKKIKDEESLDDE